VSSLWGRLSPPAVLALLAGFNLLVTGGYQWLPVARLWPDFARLTWRRLTIAHHTLLRRGLGRRVALAAVPEPAPEPLSA
jgi:hypothetical protein